jgi:hypothetical protein
VQTGKVHEAEEVLEVVHEISCQRTTTPSNAPPGAQLLCDTSFAHHGGPLKIPSRNV